MNITKKISGFTLIELMITLAIVAIIAAISYPNYSQFVRESRRTDAAGDLLELAQFFERFYTENGSYAQDTSGNAVDLPFDQSPSQGDARYNIATTTLNATEFTLQALPVGGQADDRDCGTLTLNQAGVRCINGTTVGCSNDADPDVQEAVNDCW